MTIMHDGVEVFCLPDNAYCKEAECNPIDIDDCPIGLSVCSDCIYYTEE